MCRGGVLPLCVHLWWLLVQLVLAVSRTELSPTVTASHVDVCIMLQHALLAQVGMPLVLSLCRPFGVSAVFTACLLGACSRAQVRLLM
jgi:hypothetical protein